MAMEPNSIKTLPKISIVSVGRTNVTDDGQTDRRQTDDRRTDDDVANVTFTFAKNAYWTSY